MCHTLCLPVWDELLLPRSLLLTTSALPAAVERQCAGTVTTVDLHRWRAQSA